MFPLRTGFRSIPRRRRNRRRTDRRRYGGVMSASMAECKSSVRRSALSAPCCPQQTEAFRASAALARAQRDAGAGGVTTGAVCVDVSASVPAGPGGDGGLGGPALSPETLALVSVLQYAERLTDRQLVLDRRPSAPAVADAATWTRLNASAGLLNPTASSRD